MKPYYYAVKFKNGWRIFSSWGKQKNFKDKQIINLFARTRNEAWLFVQYVEKEKFMMKFL